MTTSKLPAMKTKPRFVFFTDFDGTITQMDSNDYLTDNLGYGYEKRRAGNVAVLEDRKTFRAAFQEMLDSIHAPFPECIAAVLEHIKLDPEFKDFYAWARSQNVPVVVLSSGMGDIIRALLRQLLGKKLADGLEVVSNEVVDREGRKKEDAGGWTIKFHDDSDFGHDKSLTIRPYANLPSDIRPTLFYAGDGVSDFSAAKETDLLFAKENYDLVAYCKRDGIPFVEFKDWKTILNVTREIVDGKKTFDDVRASGQ